MLQEEEIERLSRRVAGSGITEKVPVFSEYVFTDGYAFPGFG
jgi:hypothetical protein